MKSRCPHCGARYNPPEENEGIKANCVRCHKDFVIQRYDENVQTNAAANTTDTITQPELSTASDEPLLCPKCGHEIRTDLPVQTETPREIKPLETQEPIVEIPVQAEIPVAVEPVQTVKPDVTAYDYPGKVPQKPSFFSYKGRMNRAKFILITIPITALFAAAGFGIWVMAAAINLISIIVISSIGLVTVALIAIHSLAIAKRFHDMNKSAARYFWILLPVANIVFGFILVFKKGTPAQNQYGPDPLEGIEKPKAEKKKKEKKERKKKEPKVKKKKEPKLKKKKPEKQKPVEIEPSAEEPVKIETPDGGEEFVFGPDYKKPGFFSWDGRMGRFMFFLVTMITIILLAAMAFAAYKVFRRFDLISMIILLSIAFFGMVLVLVHSFPAVKRFHDINRSAMGYLWFLAPPVNILVVLFLFFKKGTAGPNKYGPGKQKLSKKKSDKPTSPDSIND